MIHTSLDDGYMAEGIHRENWIESVTGIHVKIMRICPRGIRGESLWIPRGNYGEMKGKYSGYMTWISGRIGVENCWGFEADNGGIYGGK